MLERVWQRRKSRVHRCGNVNWHSHCEEQLWSLLRKLKTELLYDPAILLSGIYLEKIVLQKYTRTPMFIAAVLQRPRHGNNVSVHQQVN